MANEFKVKNGLIVIGDLTTSGTITINGALAATQSWVTSQAYLTSASLSGYATQSYVTSAISALIDAAPAALDTLNELAAALGDDASFSTTVTNSIAGKVAKSGDTMTGSLIFANNADDIRINKNNNWLNLYDPWNNIHLRNGNSGYGVYIDSTIHYWRPHDGSVTWMTLSSTGLGIGTGSPGSKLTVYSDTTADGILVDVLSRPRITLRDRGNSDTIIGTGDYGLDDFFIDTYSGNALAIKGSTRNVGIGTTTPSEKLDVSGNISVTSSTGTKIGFNTTDSFSGYGTSIAHYGISYSWTAQPLALSGYYGVGIFTVGTERMRINGGGKVSIGTTDTNSDKSDFTVYTGGTTTLALAGNLLRVGDTDVNWGVALRSNGVLETYGQNLYLGSAAGNYPVTINPNGTNSVSFYQTESYLNTYTRINYNWGGGPYGTEAFTIRGTYPSIALRSTNHDSKWLIHHASELQFYYGASADTNTWANAFSIPTNGDIYMSWAGSNISTLLNAKQNASTAITTSNIGSQSVSYANSAGSATTANIAGALTSMNISQFTNNSGYFASGSYSWTSPVFGQYGIKSNLIDNVLYSAADRFEVFRSGVAWNTNGPFNLNYDQSVDTIAVNTSRTYSIIFNTKGNPSHGIVYTEGTVYLSFYYVFIPGSVSGRVKDQNGVWRNIENWTNVANNGSYAVWRGNVPTFNYMVEMEITINANSSNDVWFAQWEYVMGRPGQYELGIFNKAQDNSVWRSLYFLDSSNVARVTINSGGISANTVTSNNFNVSNAIYFGGGNNYLNWTNGRIYSNVGIETANNFYVSGNIVWHAANDGSGSGLDADTVDGVQVDSIVYGNARGTNQSITNNNNDLDKTGYYTADAFTTRPSGVANWMYIEHIKLYNDNTAYQKQLGYDTYDDRMWVRTKSGGAWSSWKQIWTSDSLTNLNQLTNGPGYITSYTETDTLASVTGRGATTNTSITVGPDLTVQADGSQNYTASRLWLNSHNNYRGAGVHMSGVGSTWFAGTPYTDFDGGYVIARTGTSNDVSSAQYSNALLTIKSNGNVGIGTSNPSTRFHLEAPSSDGNPVFRLNGTTAPNAFNYAGSLMNANLGSSRNTILLIGKAESNRDSGYIGFNHSGTNSSNTNFLTFGLFQNDNILNITGAGNVGIGTTNPIYKLQVVGSAYVNGGTLFLDSSQYLRWGNSNQGIVGVNDDHVAIVSGGATRQTVYADGRTYFPGLDLSISNVNSSHGTGTYFRGSSTHFVLGLNNGNTLYLNYGNEGGSLQSFGTWSHQNVQILSTTRVLTNVSGNISMFTNDAGYLTSYSETDTLQSVTSRGATTTNRLEFQYSVDRYSQAWRNTSTGAYWWVTTDSDKLGLHLNGDGDKFYFGNNGDFYSTANGWLSSALAAKQNAATAINTSNIGSQSVSYANSAGEAGQVTNQTGQLLRFDNRIISPSETTAGYLQFGFTSWTNDNNAPYADYLHLRSYTDGSGGNDNLVMFLKSGIGMRIYQQTFGSATAYSSYADVWTSANFTSTNVSNWNTAYGWGNHASQGYATTSYVTTQINNLINGAPGALDTLSELASALGNDASFATTVTNSIASKLSLAGGTLTGALTLNAELNAYASPIYVNEIRFRDTSGSPASDPYSMRWVSESSTRGAGLSWLEFQLNDDNNEEIRIYGNSCVGYGCGAVSENLYHRFRADGYAWHAGNLSVVGTISASGYNDSNWNTAYGWGNHASAGYALNSSLANYLPLSGGVIGGAVTINGNLTVNGTITENSSIKLKENVQTSEGNLEKVVNLRPVTYNKIGSQTTELGLIAEEVAEVYPEFVQYDENGEPIGVHYSRLTAALIGAVKELTNQVQELNKKING